MDIVTEQWRVKCHGNELFTSTFRKWQQKSICQFPYTNSRVYKYMWNNVIFLFVIWIEHRKRMKAFTGLFHKPMKICWSCSFSHSAFQILYARKQVRITSRWASVDKNIYFHLKAGVSKLRPGGRSLLTRGFILSGPPTMYSINLLNQYSISYNETANWRIDLTFDVILTVHRR